MSTHVMTGTEAKSYATGERVRAVLSGESEVAHVWASHVQTHGRFRAIYFSGARLYSYGSHYVIGETRPDGVVLLNAERNSLTTNGHRQAAQSATRHKTQHYVPDLTAALKILDDVKRYRKTVASERKQGADFENPESYASRSLARYEYERRQLRGFIKRHALGDRGSGEFSEGAPEYLLKLAGWPASSWPKIKREAEREAAADKLEAEREAKRRALEDAKRFGAMNDSDFRQFLPPDNYLRDAAAGDPGTLADGNGEHAQKQFAKRMAAAHKASKAAGFTARTARLWLRVKEARQWASEYDSRVARAAAVKLRLEFENARTAGRLAELPLWRFGGSMAAEIQAAKQGLEEEQAAEDYKSWKETPTAVKRPDSRRYPEGSTQRRVLEEFERKDAEDKAATFERWREAVALAKRRGADMRAIHKPSFADFSQGGLVARYPDIMERLAGDPASELLSGFTKQEAEEHKAAKIEAERLRNASLEEKRAAWINGAKDSALGLSYGRLDDGQGGALIRIEGEGEGAELVTSQGARVPLTHAIRAFRFVKLIRQTSGAWHKNGRSVRVGHYTLDSIDPDGFNAGCHRINWPEIERVAKLAGVFELEPSDAAAEPTHAAA